MLYETCTRSEEILDVNIENLDLAGRRCPVKSKGAQPKVRPRGATRADYLLETAGGRAPPPRVHVRQAQNAGFNLFADALVRGVPQAADARWRRSIDFTLPRS